MVRDAATPRKTETVTQPPPQAQNKKGAPRFIMTDSFGSADDGDRLTRTATSTKQFDEV
jgi:hypothetical protein